MRRGIAVKDGLAIAGAAAAGAIAAVLGGGLPAWWIPVLVGLPVAAAVPVLRRRRGSSAPRPASSETATRAAGALSAESLADALDDPLLVLDRSGTIRHANAAAERAFGAIATGMPVRLRFRAPELQELFQSVLGGPKREDAIELVEKVPFERVFRVTLGAADPARTSYVLAFRDQSETRRIERMRADFIANASHELRTPLASVSGFIETLRGPARNDTAARERFLQIMQNQTARMARLIDDLLSLSRLEMKPLGGQRERIALAPLIDEVADSLNHLAAESGVVFERDYAPDLPPVRGSRDELIQVFENLIENACKYGQSGGRVLLSVQRGAEGIDASVTDFGPGIPAEHLPRVTERFYRIDVDSSRAQKGTGLGLSIVKHIVTRHDARLSIASEAGSGTRFTVHFPASPD